MYAVLRIIINEGDSMTQIDVFSGFLGAGKTTLIKKMLKEAYVGQKVVLIENEFGEIGIDGGFMKEAGIQVTEMNSGCICCSLVGDFGEALKKVLDTYHPDRILIEPSGVGKLSDVVKAASVVCGENCKIGALVAVVDAGKCKMYAKNFGEFFLNQIEHAAAVVLSRTDIASEDKIAACIALVREHNPNATIISTPMAQLDGKQILDAMGKEDTLKLELEHMMDDMDDECDDPDCECHHHHHDEDEEEHHHHHHHHDDDEECDDPECDCHHHHDEDEEEHHHHHADEVFTSWGRETAKKYSKESLAAILEKLSDSETYGAILRAKGIVPSEDGQWIHFDYTPGESEIRYGTSEVIGRLCVIGSKIQEEALASLFGVH